MEAIDHLLNKIIREIKELPPLPDVVVKVMQITRSPDVTARQLNKVISQDQGLTGNVLRLCNSAYYGLPRAVSSLSQAVMYLGFHTIRNLILTCSISNLFSMEKKNYGYSRGGLWYHSVTTAMISEFICKKINPDLRDTVFTAGLLHDIGQVIMGVKLKDTTETIVDLMTNNGLSDVEAEHEAVGFSHDELGSLVADNWNFPDELVHAIRYHHFPEKAKTKLDLTSIVHLGDSIALQLGFGVELEQMKYPARDFALEATKLSRQDLETLTEEARELVEKNAESFLLRSS